MRKRRAAAIVSVVSTLFFVGCSLFVDTSGLGGDSAADASSDAPDDRTTTGETSADTSTGPIDAGPTCDGTFCDDFDDGAVGARWTSKDLQGGGQLDLVTAAGSRPSALRARFVDPPTNSMGVALLEKDLGMGKHVRCEFSMFMEVRPTANFVDVVRLRTTASGLKEYALLFGVNAGNGATFREDFFASDGGCFCPRKDGNPPTFPVLQWVRVGFETNFSTASLSYDGVTIASGTFGEVTPTSNVFIALGSIAYEKQPSVVLFDDLVCTIAP